MADPKDIDEAMLAFQADPPVLTKDKRAHQSKYADLVQATEVILPRLNALGVIWKTWTEFLEDGKFVLRYELRHVASGTSEPGTWPLKLSENPQQMGSQVTYARRYALTVATGVAAEDEDDDGNAGAGRQYAQRAQRQAPRQRPVDEPDDGGRTAQRRAQPARGARPPLPGEDNGKVDQKQHRHMHALWRELGAGGDEHRDFRLRKTAEWLGLESLDTSADLTREQADLVIGRLRERKEQMATQAAEGGDA